MKEQVYDYLFDQLGQSALEPGVYLDLNQIAATLGISRTPLRDALIYLEVEGYVEIVPRRGVRVKQLGLDEIREIYQVVGALESNALLETAQRFSADDRRNLVALTEEYRKQLQLGSYDGCLDMNYKFHNYFIERCNNQLLAHLIKAQKQRLYDWPRHTALLPEWEQKNVEEHERIVELLLAGDPKGASELLRDVHWGFAEQERFIHPFYVNPRPKVTLSWP